jgi:glucose/arabinose dehydrogenase/N-acetylneuraminic acid mutarotase
VDFWKDLTHGELGVPPVIHSMPTLGVETGGNAILIDGFGYYPRSQLILHWGLLQVPGDQLDAWSSDRLLFTSPPGTGVIPVQVETPFGMSNIVQFEYSPSGPIPITFDHLEDREVFSYLASTAAWGPDRRLWVGKVTGQLEAITFDESWNMVSKVTYPGVAPLDNSDVLGIAFDPYDWRGGEPVRVYVAHGEHYANGGGSFSGPSPYTGQISVVEGPLFDSPQPLITGLPVSNHDHGINGLEFDNDGNLLICVGGNTNAGVKWPLIGDLPESPLSGAILRAFTMRPGFDGAIEYAFSDTGLPSVSQVDGEEVDQVAGQVEVLASGLRNSYDLVLSTRGTWYATDNGPNLGYGPPSTGPDTQGTLHPQEPDELVLLESGRYYGHPNRSRGRWQPFENVYHAPWQPDQGRAHTAPLTLLDSSADGIIEYRSAAFGGQLRGDLITQKWNSPLRWIDLDETGRAAQSVTQLSPTLAGLDVVTGPGGALISADYSNSKVKVMVPAAGLTGPLQLWDVHPWRAPRAGGGRFVLGGRSFGDLGNTLVLMGGVPAQILSVTSTRIEGILPVGPAIPTGELVDVEVRVGTASSVLPDAFLWLPSVRGEARGRWSAGADLPDALGEVSTAVLDGRLFVVGEGSSKTYALDLATGVWDDTLATRPYAGSHHATQVVGDRIFLFGGLGAGLGKVQIYDPASDSWALGADMPWSGGSCSSALIDGLVYVCGGIVGSSTVANLASYDPVLDQWDASLPPMPTGVNHAASATDGRYLFVFGGRQGGNTPQPGFDNVQRFDPLTLQWLDSDQPLSGLTPMPLPRGGTGRAVFHSGRFWVMGGETSGGTVFEDVQTYDPVEDRWALDAPLPTARHGIDPVRDGDRIWVVGGGIVAGFSASDAVEVLQR